MSKANQEKKANEPGKSNDATINAISKIHIIGIKSGRITSEAPTKPEKPSKENK